jgi:hypothetical protein
MLHSVFGIVLLVICLPIAAFSQGNTLVTGVVSDQNGRVPNDPLVLRIYAGKRKVAEIKTREGLFSCDLKGKVASNEQITVALRSQTFDAGQSEKARKYSDATVNRPLNYAQNIKLQVNFEYIRDQPVVGPYSEIPTQ